ncbi:MAG TPA: hypothetical protein VFH88_05670 [Candidatus Krumholzibacteria bacterium]|nr:hypothetical protein [Candidatus Krumholzibacteria bacterium]
MLRKLIMGMTALMMVAGVAGAAGDVNFGYKFKVGGAEKYHLLINTEMEMTGMKASQIADMTVTVTCVSSKPGAYAMNMTFDNVETTNTISGSSQPDPSAEQMIGKSVLFTVDEHGTVSNVAPGPDFEAWASVQRVVEPTLKNWYVFMPDKAVAAGSGWKRDNYRDTSVAGSEYVTNEKYTFRETKDEGGASLAVVDQDVTTKVGGTTQTPMGNFDIAGTGSGKFEFYFDAGRGVITHYKGSMQTDINMTPQSGGDAMKTSVTNHIERELLK